MKSNKKELCSKHAICNYHLLWSYFISTSPAICNYFSVKLTLRIWLILKLKFIRKIHDIPSCIFAYLLIEYYNCNAWNIQTKMYKIVENKYLTNETYINSLKGCNQFLQESSGRTLFHSTHLWTYYIFIFQWWKKISL